VSDFDPGTWEDADPVRAAQMIEAIEATYRPRPSGVSDTRTMTVAEFLRARLDEDEADARAITEGSWEDATLHGDHVLRWSPARVLAECEAKRRIVEGEPARIANDRHSQWERTLRDLAAVYSDHPGYDEEWRP
jgi:hypothetical protein